MPAIMGLSIPSNSSNPPPPPPSPAAAPPHHTVQNPSCKLAVASTVLAIPILICTTLVVIIMVSEIFKQMERFHYLSIEFFFLSNKVCDLNSLMFNLGDPEPSPKEEKLEPGGINPMTLDMLVWFVGFMLLYILAMAMVPPILLC